MKSRDTIINTFACVCSLHIAYLKAHQEEQQSILTDVFCEKTQYFAVKLDTVTNSLAS